MKFPKSTRGRRGAGRWLPRGRNVAVLAGAVVLAGSGAAYGMTPANRAHAKKATTSAAATKVTIAYTVPNADQMLAPVTQAAGLFKKNGIDANIEFLQASLALPALVSGQVQFMIVGAPSAEVASLSGTPLQYIGSWEHVLDAEIVANKSIGSPSELNGKTIGISSAGALSDFLVQLADHQYGINMHEVPLGQLPNETAAYVHGSIDAISGTNIWQLPTLESDVPGTHVVVDFRHGTNYPGAGGIIADANWLKGKGNGATAVKVLKALYQGISYYKTHQSKAVPIIANLTDEPTGQATQSYQITKALYSNSIAPVLADQKNVLKALAWTNPTASGFSAAKLMNASYAKQAMSKKK